MGRWPRRTLWPTRDGWWCLFAAVGLGFAAINTGNNLLYLLVSMLLGLIIVSGVLSEQSIRGLRCAAVLPDEIYAGRPALFGARVVNRKRWLRSYSVTIDALGAPGGTSVWLPRLAAGAERLVTWEATLPRRGRHRFGGFRVSTRFPFGLFVKAAHLRLESEAIVYPAVTPLARDVERALGGVGVRAARRRGRGDELANLREYRTGDDPRAIHWRSSAKTQSLMVREFEADAATDTRLVLEGSGARDPARLERGLSEAASLAAHLIKAGGVVELMGPDVFVPAGRGGAHQRRLLTALALYAPPAEAAALRAAAPASRMREIRVRLD